MMARTEGDLMSEQRPTATEIAQMFNELEAAEGDLADARKDLSKAHNRVVDLVNTVNTLRDDIQAVVRQCKIDEEVKVNL